MKITKTMYTETAHRLSTHPGLCKNVHGHSYKWEITLESPQLNLDGMLLDFSELKEKAGGFVNGLFDHAIVLENCADNAELIEVLERMKMRVTVFQMPTTAENMSTFVKNELSIMFPDFDVSVALWETTTSKVEA